MVVVPYVRGLSEQFIRLDARHAFRTVLKRGTKIKELKNKVSYIYEITCKCKNAAYVGETPRLFKARGRKKIKARYNSLMRRK